jgi:hypothetical protein
MQHVLGISTNVYKMLFGDYQLESLVEIREFLSF